MNRLDYAVAGFPPVLGIKQTEVSSTAEFTWKRNLSTVDWDMSSICSKLLGIKDQGCGQGKGGVLSAYSQK